MKVGVGTIGTAGRRYTPIPDPFPECAHEGGIEQLPIAGTSYVLRDRAVVTQSSPRTGCWELTLENGNGELELGTGTGN
jgi:hypothetical protein